MKRLPILLLLLPTLVNAVGITLKQVESVTIVDVPGQPTQKNVTWQDQPTAGSIGYIVQRCTGNCTPPAVGFVEIARVGLGVKNFVDTGPLTLGTSYTWAVYENPSLMSSATPTSTTITTTNTTTTTITTTSTTVTTTSTTTLTTTTVTTSSTTTTGTGPTTSSTTTTTVTTTTVTTTTSTSTTTTSSTTTTTISGNDPKLIGFVAGVGSAHDVVADPANPRVYVGSNSFGVSVVDVTTPATPTGIGGANPSFVGQNIAVVGARGVAANGVNGFTTIDLTSVTAPITKTTLAGTYRAVTLVGSTAYAIQFVPGNPGHLDLVVIDVTTIATPTVLGRVTVPGGTGVKVSGNFAYVSTGGGLQVVNVTTPSNPQLAGFAPTSSSSQQSGDALAISGFTAFAAEDPNGVRVFNISNPSAPGLITTIVTPVTAVAVNGTQLFVTTAATLKIYDVSNLATPVFLGSGTSPDGASFVAVDVKGTTAYTANANINPATGAGGLYTWNVATPSSPVLLGHFSGIYDNWSVARSGSTAVVTQNAIGLKVINVGTLTAPTIVGSIAGSPTTSVMHDAVMAGTKAYIANFIPPGNPGHTDLIVVDLATPSAPNIVGRVTVPGGSTGVALSGTNVYMAGSNGSATITVIDVSTPSNPQIVNTVAVGGTAGGIAVNGNRLYFAQGTLVRAFDLSTPSLPASLGTVAMAGSQAFALAVSGTNLAVIDGLTLRMVDASVPSAMVLKGTFNIAALGGSSVGYDSTNRVFIPSVQSVAVINASNISALTLQKKIPLAGSTTAQINGGNALVQGNNVFIGDSAAVIDILQITF